jgi:hypothetical protein
MQFIVSAADIATFEVSTVLLFMTIHDLGITPCRLAKTYRRFGGVCCLRIQNVTVQEEWNARP